ncbi:aminoglycoside phosphotransferase family protein [Streptomyces sp. NPDC093221]|uniref:aminoglycoside phosphotransferase family protein n=1 Tax=Streptomyces sp. NPDC093221 TaxID=3366032 RepID=UPI0038075EEC
MVEVDGHGHVTADAEVVRWLVREQHPDLAELELRPVDGGWDNQLWRLGEELAVRLPRTPRAPALLAKERRWLPLLAPRLPLPVPTPVRDGEPSARFPRPWAVTRWVPGSPADLTPIGRGEHAADALAGFLTALHRKAPADAPANPDRGVPLKSLADGFDQGVAALAEGGLDARLADGARRVWADAVAAPESTAPPTWLHGDLHPANVVVTDGTLAGVIDFGELCAGDAANDLGAAWLLLPAGAAPRFFAAYGRTDPATIRRARGYAVRATLGLISVGQAAEKGLPGGKPTWGVAGRAALERVLADV